MKKIIVANWKCNPNSLKKAKEIFNLVKKKLKNLKKIKVVICPPFVYLSNIQYPKSNIQLGAQNCFWEESGAFTGEISPLMLKNLGCQYVILGHSERRRYFGETDQIINKKIKLALSAKLTPILCIGETQKEREEGKVQEILTFQLKNSLKKIPPKSLINSQLIIAYEPVWAIGTGNPCQPEEAERMNILIRKIINKLYKNQKIAKNLPILYGGSVNSKNAKNYLEAHFQGLLVGSASLNPQEFIKIVKVFSQTPEK
jgi:triosephosphate isomerase